jgi:hypothetical protein
MQGQEYTATDQYTLDGKECKNKGFRDTETLSTAQWAEDGQSIMIKTKIPTENGEMTFDRNIKLNGSNLELDVTVKGSWGESSETWIFDKE